MGCFTIQSVTIQSVTIQSVTIQSVTIQSVTIQSVTLQSVTRYSIDIIFYIQVGLINVVQNAETVMHVQKSNLVNAMQISSGQLHKWLKEKNHADQ